ncbi:MAG: MarR family transcriptional regulator [Betaproteobacteria bacterium]
MKDVVIGFDLAIPGTDKSVVTPKKNGHGGARPGSGPKPVEVNERRVAVLVSEGVTQTEIARRMGVSRGPIRRVVQKLQARGELK